MRAAKRRLVIACLLLGLVVGYWWSAVALGVRQPIMTDQDSSRTTNRMPLPVPPANLQLPSTALSPRQVVTLQMKALSAYVDDRAAIHQVFAYASPSNRALTGPLSRFEQIILQPSYHALVACNHYMVGKIVEQDNIATVLVTTVDRQGQLSIYRFLLSKQVETYLGCWMTDAVLQLVSKWRPGEALPSAQRALPSSI